LCGHEGAGPYRQSSNVSIAPFRYEVEIGDYVLSCL
jgi:hypothetical protein